MRERITDIFFSKNILHYVTIYLGDFFADAVLDVSVTQVMSLIVANSEKAIQQLYSAISQDQAWCEI